MIRVFVGVTNMPKKRLVVFLLLLLMLIGLIVFFSAATSGLDREKEMEEMIVKQQTRINFLESQYRGRQEDVINLQAKIDPEHAVANIPGTMTPEVKKLVKDLAGTRAGAGMNIQNLQQLRTPFVYQLLPHLMNDPSSLKPAYHMRGSRKFSNIVIGVPTVKRDMESYLMTTLEHLIDGMTTTEANSTTIVVMVGETDMEYVLHIAMDIEVKFPNQVQQGLVEVLAPSPSYYPDFDSLPDTLGDSHKRAKWRTKQNLDTIYLMAYAQSKGTYYLMLEDDVIAKKNYIQDITEFTAATTVTNPDWFFIEYCHVGGIGKFFRSADLSKFITYVQLFYTNMPIDWLLESYLTDRTCTIYKKNSQCTQAKLKIRPKYKKPLFQHIGLYSSLKGKIHKVKSKMGPVPTHYPHTNPPIKAIKSSIDHQGDHTLDKVYYGTGFYWGIKPKKGDYIEIWFEKPTKIERYTFRTGNIEHVNDRFYDTTVEILPYPFKSFKKDFKVVGAFDEFGIAEGNLKTGSIVAMRLHVNSNSSFWVVLNEIELKEASKPATS